MKFVGCIHNNVGIIYKKYKYINYKVLGQDQGNYNVY